MKLYQQLVLFMLAATVLPLALVGFLVLSRAERALSERISAEQRALATATAEGVAAELMETVDAVARVAELIDWQSASEEESRGALSLLYNQSNALSAVLRLDAEGHLQGQPVFQAEDGGDHPAFDPKQVERLIQAVPVQTLRHGGKGEVALGRAYSHGANGMAAVAIAVKLDLGEKASFALAEIVFRDLEDLLRRRAEGLLGRMDLVDGAGRILASSHLERRLKPLEEAIAQRLSQGGDKAAQTFRAGEPVLRVSAARVPAGLGFQVVLSVAEEDALAPVRSLRRTVLMSIGLALLVLLALGGLFTRRINQRLSDVVAGAEAFGRGELDRRVKVEGSDELSALAATFNHMGAELETARARLMRWNDDLRLRVDEALADLRTAQAQLVETQKLAAVGQLGAGVAHELNNPLAGILGYVQLMLMSRPDSDPDLDMLRKIEGSAKRCKEITQNLLRFSQQRERTDLRAVDLNTVVRDALTLTENQVQAEGITLALELAPQGARVMADSGQTSQAILALVSNARTAMQKSATKTLTVRTGEREGRGFFEVEDTGKGISPEHRNRIFEPFFTTKDVWSNVGLGLSVTYRVVTEAGGSIDVRSEPGKGSCFTVWLTKA